VGTSRAAFLSCLLASCGTGNSVSTETTNDHVSPHANAVADPCSPDFGTEVSPGVRFEDVSDAVAWPTAGATFTASVSRAGGRLRVEGTLTNTTDAELSVDYLTGGVMGLSTNPFDVAIEGESRAATGPEVYPSPRRAILPPHGTVVFRVDRCPSFPARVRWTFTPWSGPPEQASLVVP
jgi:hypothetical protein